MKSPRRGRTPSTHEYWVFHRVVTGQVLTKLNCCHGRRKKNTQMSFYFAAAGLEKKTHVISEMRSIIQKRLSYSLLMETTFLYHKGEKNR